MAWTPTLVCRLNGLMQHRSPQRCLPWRIRWIGYFNALNNSSSDVKKRLFSQRHGECAENERGPGSRSPSKKQDPDSKAAINLLTKSWAAEYGVRRPRQCGQSRTHKNGGYERGGEGVEQLAAKAPVGRLATADEIAEAIVFLRPINRVSFMGQRLPSTAAALPSEMQTCQSAFAMLLIVTSDSGASGNGFGALHVLELDGTFRGTFIEDDRIANPRGLAVERPSIFV